MPNIQDANDGQDAYGGQDAYDVVAYPGLPFAQTHPDTLATMATLHGLSPAPVNRCRVLEVACNEGGNLIPMAYAMPGSEFVGFDLARLPVERGQRRIRELGLTNIRIFQANALDVGAELGQFDYIIAHGFYAWVPEPVSDRLLALCNELLAPEGVAFISYNALPGGHVRSVVRELMQYRVQGTADVERQVADGYAFIHGLLASRPGDDPWRALIEEHVKKMEERGPRAIYHDELSGAFRQVHFIDFARHAERHGLQFMCEAVLPPPPDPCYKFDIRSLADGVSGGDFLAAEQLLDYARMRKYRESLLCRADRAVRRDYPSVYFRRLLLASQAAMSPSEKAGAVIFTLSSGIKMESNHPVAIALLSELTKAWPRALAYEELEPRLAAAGFALDANGVALLMRLAVAKFIHLHAWRPLLADGIAERPRASACARHEIRSGSQATTLLHSSIRFDDAMSRRLMTLLDGTHARAEIVETLKVEFPGEPAAEVEARLEPNLQTLYRAGILEG